MRITSKGQVTIPQPIREQCGLLLLLVKQDPPSSPWPSMPAWC
ncbi:hypothetical protein OGCDGJMD_02892 [Cyanobium usitatum str. Tous]|jgi:hypothetical protein|nr:hypothetical protein [Cyanobium usitatum]CAK6700607.1 hypothetical protein OGCDGJMD_02892 [Cyanobium usitatum str. Tous]